MNPESSSTKDEQLRCTISDANVSRAVPKWPLVRGKDMQMTDSEGKSTKVNPERVVAGSTKECQAVVLSISQAGRSVIHHRQRPPLTRRKPFLQGALELHETGILTWPQADPLCQPAID